MVELMVAMVAGLLLVAAVTSLFATILKANQIAMQTSRLNQELQSITDMIARDGQRAGYDWAATSFLAAVSGARSPFYFDTNSDLMSETSTGSQVYRCIRLKYDDNDNGSLDADETFIYSYDSTNKGVKLGGSCTSGSLLSSESTIEVTGMTLSLLGSSVSSGARTVRLSITGQHKANTALKLTLQRDIKLRNDGY
ncbi:type IV pilin [Aeromonas veronii]|uniref:PilW family protein n=1 Tax=Aeromonas veronii TaxID=654 RepID=UPI002AC892E3|nr:type IV pilin [Aeromonas veronii]MCF5907521.1 type IV pilin [Aeromonas veronii]